MNVKMNGYTTEVFTHIRRCVDHSGVTSCVTHSDYFEREDGTVII